MRALSKTTVAIIAELHRVAGERSWFRAGRDQTATEIAALLQQIAEAREPLAIPRVIAMTLDARREIAEVTGETIRSLRQLVATQDLAFFDRAFRELSPWMRPETARWTQMGVSDLKTVASLRTAPTLLQLAMCHPSGYVREEAIRRSATAADGSEIGFLLLRTNDWVTQVRDLAHSALRVRLTIEHLPDLLAALPILDAMPRWSRGGASAISEQIEALLRDPKAHGALIAALESLDRFVRRGAYRRLFEHGRLLLDSSANDGPYRSAAGAPKAEIVAAALGDRDAAVRSWAGRWLLSGGEDAFLSFSDKLLRSRLGSIRFGAAQRLRASGRPLPWADLLSDSHAGVRALAQAAALDAGTSPDEEYRVRLKRTSGARLGFALVGLSETGGPSDAEAIRTFLRNELPVVRRSALLALDRFKVDDIVPLALNALFDDSPTVTKAARELLLARTSSLKAQEVWLAFTKTTSVAGKKAAVAVLASLGFWESVSHLIRATRDDAAKQVAARYVERWLLRQNRVFVAPSSAIAAEIRSAMREDGVADGIRREVSAVLDARLKDVGPR
ncbi:MAG TPA: hypothetical protein VMJ10_33270 [Kofleriaceae bacterium]|nr:hypothetical protein [Kofleriaceae bacterium]